MAQLVVSKKELEAVFALGAEQRYRYFVKRIADSETAWSLWDGEAWFMYRAADGRQFFPVWPAKEYAAACAEESWSGAGPQPIGAVRLIDEFLPAMEADGILPTIFPTPAGDGIAIPPSTLKSDLNTELAKY